MREILDETDAPVLPSPIYSRLALAVGVVTVCLVLALLLLTPITFKPSHDLHMKLQVISILALVFCGLGLVLTIASIQRRERWSWYKVLGTILNLGLLVLILGVIIFAQVV